MHYSTFKFKFKFFTRTNPLYSRKLNVYNLGVYELAVPHRAFCYCWPEVEGKRRSNDIGSAVFYWLKPLPLSTKHVSLFWDTCNGQNRNQYIASMMLYAVQSIPYIESITHMFLDSGHSHNECDRVHAAIERVKNILMFTLWSIGRTFLGKQGDVPNEYNVMSLGNEDFMHLKICRHLSWNIDARIQRQGYKNKLATNKIDDIQEGGAGNHLLRYIEDYKAMNVYPVRSAVANLKKAYNGRIPISKQKKLDLIKLCDQTVEWMVWSEKLGMKYTDGPKPYHPVHMSKMCCPAPVTRIPEANRTKSDPMK